MKKVYIGHVKVDKGDEKTFEFEVKADATSEEIEIAAVTAMWDSDIFDIYWTADYSNEKMKEEKNDNNI